MPLPHLEDLDIQNKKVLVRVDFNVPLDKAGGIVDDTRLRESLPTIRYILEHGGSVILLSHLGRPKGKIDLQLSLQTCATHLATLLHHPVQFHNSCIGEETREICRNLLPGQVLLLENLRFYRGEEKPEEDPSFTEQLASLGDIYINDAFGSAHRTHASTTLLAHHFKGNRAAGFLLHKEIQQLSLLLSSPKHPFYTIIGGAKISTKIGVLHSLLDKTDAFFIGGGMAYTFLAALGKKIGDSIFEPDRLEQAKKFLTSCRQKNISVFLPEDLVISNAFEDDAKTEIVTVEEGIPEKWQGMDLGPDSLRLWEKQLCNAKTIFWNGPVGVFEFPHFAKGTRTLSQFLATLDCIKIVGGGDSVAAITALGLEKQFTHISTGGGAALEFIEHGTLPGIEALQP